MGVAYRCRGTILGMAVDWARELTAEADLEMRQGASGEDVARVEKALGTAFPEELRDLLLTSNGVYSRGGGWLMLWPLERILEWDVEAWRDEPAGSGRLSLIGFGDDGTGAPFCVSRDGGPAVYIWEPIDADMTLLGATLAEFWQRWKTDSLPRY